MLQMRPLDKRIELNDSRTKLAPTPAPAPGPYLCHADGPSSHWEEPNVADAAKNVITRNGANVVSHERWHPLFELPQRATKKRQQMQASERSQRISLKEPDRDIFDYSSKSVVAEEPPPSPEIRYTIYKYISSAERKKVIVNARVLLPVKSVCVFVRVCVWICICASCMFLRNTYIRSTVRPKEPTNWFKEELLLLTKSTVPIASVSVCGKLR